MTYCRVHLIIRTVNSKEISGVGDRLQPRPKCEMLAKRLSSFLRSFSKPQISRLIPCWFLQNFIVQGLPISIRKYCFFVTSSRRLFFLYCNIEYLGSVRGYIKAQIVLTINSTLESWVLELNKIIELSNFVLTSGS